MQLGGRLIFIRYLTGEVTLAFVHSAWVSVFSAGFGNLLDIPYCHGSTIRSRATPYLFIEVPFEILLSSGQLASASQL